MREGANYHTVLGSACSKVGTIQQLSTTGFLSLESQIEATKIEISTVEHGYHTAREASNLPHPHV